MRNSTSRKFPQCVRAWSQLITINEARLHQKISFGNFCNELWGLAIVTWLPLTRSKTLPNHFPTFSLAHGFLCRLTFTSSFLTSLEFWLSSVILIQTRNYRPFSWMKIEMKRPLFMKLLKTILLKCKRIFCLVVVNGWKEL